MLIELDCFPISLSVLPVYSIAPNKRVFPVPLLFTVGWNYHLYMFILAFHCDNEKSFRSSYWCSFCFLPTGKTMEQQQEAWPKNEKFGSLRKAFFEFSTDFWVMSDESLSLVSSGLQDWSLSLLVVASNLASLNLSKATAVSSGKTKCVFGFGWNVKSITVIVLALLFVVGHVTFKSLLQISVVSSLLKHTVDDLVCELIL